MSGVISFIPLGDTDSGKDLAGTFYWELMEMASYLWGEIHAGNKTTFSKEQMDTLINLRFIARYFKLGQGLAPALTEAINGSQYRPIDAKIADAIQRATEAITLITAK